MSSAINVQGDAGVEVAVAARPGARHASSDSRADRYQGALSESYIPTGPSADRSFPCEPVQGKIEPLHAALVQEVARNGTTEHARDCGCVQVMLNHALR